MIYPVRALPVLAGTMVVEVVDISGNSSAVCDLRWRHAMDGSSQVRSFEGQAWTPRPRGVGRPSLVVRYAPQVSQWLREDSDLSGAEILRRARLAGYRGGKSALYELVRRLRDSGLDNPHAKLVKP
jgi:hypothetical protein